MASTLTDLTYYWKLDEATGARANAVAGGPSLAETGTVSARVVARGKAAVFTGVTGQFLSLASTSALARGDLSWTWSCWVQFDSVAVGQYVASQANDGGSGRDWYLSTTGGPRLLIQFFNGSTQVGSATSSSAPLLVAGRRHHVVWYYSHERGKLGIVVDGNPADEVTVSGPPGSSGSAFRLGTLFVGAVGISAATDGLGYWTRELTTAEIRELYSAGAAPDYPFDVLPLATANGGSLTGGTYNLSGTLTAWNAAKAGLPGTPAGVLFDGHSIIQGFSANSIEATSWVDWFRMVEQRRYGLLGGGRGFLPFSTYSQDVLDPGKYRNLRWTIGGAVINPPSPNDWGVGGYTKGLGGGSGSYLAAEMQYGDRYYVHLLEGPDTGQCTAQIGSETAVTIGKATAPAAYEVNSYLLTSTVGVGTRAIRVNAPTTIGKNCYLIGVTAVVGTTGLRVHQAGFAGGTSASLWGTDNLLRYLDGFNISGFNIKLAVLATSVNDYTQQTPLVDYAANLDRIILKLKAFTSAPSILLIVDAKRDSGVAIPQTDYNAVLYSKADQHNCALLDFYSLWGTVADAVAAGLTVGSGDIHWLDKGHEDAAIRVLTIADTPVVPATPTALTGSRSVIVTWVASENATGYRLRRTLAGVTTTVYDGSALTYTDTPTGNQQPMYTVSAYNITGESAESSAVVPEGLGGGNDMTLAELKAELDARGLVSDALPAVDGSGRVSLAPTGLDAIPVTAPAGVAGTFREMIVQVWRRFFARATKGAAEIRTYADDDATVLTTQTISVSGPDEIVEAAT